MGSLADRKYKPYNATESFTKIKTDTGLKKYVFYLVVYIVAEKSEGRKCHFLRFSLVRV